MKQRCLIKPRLVDESPPPFELDAASREDLITLMATAIEDVSHHIRLHQPANGILIDERTTPSQDHS